MTKIHTKYQYNSKLSINENALASKQAWLDLKAYCEATFIKGTWRLSPCSDVAFIDPQIINYNI